MQNLRWKIITILAVFVVFAAVGVYPIVAAQLRHHVAQLARRQAAEARTRPEGRRAPRAARADRRCAAHRDRVGSRAAARGAADAQHHRRPISPPPRRRSSGSKAFRPTRTPPSESWRSRPIPTSTASSTVGGTYTFTMKPNVQATLREEAVTQARQTIERRVNELGVTEPSIAQQGSQGDQILVQLPGVTDVNRAKEIIRSTGLLELKIVEQGPSASRDAFLAERPGAAGHGDRARVERSDRRAGYHGLLSGETSGRGQRPRPAERPPFARREQPPGRQPSR